MIIQEEDSVVVIDIRKSRVAAQGDASRRYSRCLTQNEASEIRTGNNVYEHCQGLPLRRACQNYRIELQPDVGMLRGDSELLRKRVTDHTAEYHFGRTKTGHVDVAGSKRLIGVIDQSVDTIRRKVLQRILCI